MLSERAAPLRARADDLLGPAVQRTRERLAPLTDRIRSRLGREVSEDDEVEEPAARI